ncbi:type IV pilus assembly protein PilM [Desulfurivibrio alkaliphilus]|uniref:Type IV pilus assembly protein PilM n=1 Tax=Desulfurivibrio alkaliphilus (strain DSM 19089 / UNIQEM U267 / AHT2) TaxID=589865 RepID=D6Z6Z1_DESAT|nr:type IV pilus assembly protein PilM [Desulfurivibrio alkaliphilus]ADH86978.1 type IV pilus assembly protein PilM [Desulfurivibrio alkaliphilus AHT 2]
MALTLPNLKKISLSSLGRLTLPGGGRSALALGLDIGSHAVKVCELHRLTDGYRLLTLGSALIPPEATEDGALLDAEAVAGVLSPLLANLKSKNRKVAISVSGYSVIVKKINLQVMSTEELEKHIIEEAEQYIPFDIDDVYLDFHDLQTNREGDENTDVMLVAAKKELVDGYLELLDGLGLEAVVVDVDAFALENAFDAHQQQAENVALVDIGAGKMNINLLSGGSSALTRDITLGGRDLTIQLQNSLGLSFDEAEALKTGKMPAPSEETRQKAAEIVQDTCRQWSEEIKRAIAFYLSSNEDQPISRIVISGGSARLTGLADYLAQQCELPCTVFNPFTRIEYDPKKIDPEYLQVAAPEMGQAFGLATRSVEF